MKLLCMLHREQVVYEQREDARNGFECGTLFVFTAGADEVTNCISLLGLFLNDSERIRSTALDRGQATATNVNG